jgi:hypothetical protein
MTLGREKPRIFAFLERLAESQQGPRLQDDGELRIRLQERTVTQDPKRSDRTNSRFGARRRARPLMSNWCFINKDSATTTRTPLSLGGDAEVTYAEITDDGMVRHPVFKALHTPR